MEVKTQNKVNNVMEKCISCNSTEVLKVFSLGKIPLGYPIQDPASEIWAQNLELFFCNKCKLVQNRHEMPSDKLLEENLYLSKHSQMQNEHNDQFVFKVIEYCENLKNEDIIVEIGCGDGELLRKFMNKGYSFVIGIEPSIHDNVDYDFELIDDLFNKKVINEIINSYKKPKLIIANYVLDVVVDLDTFIMDIAQSIDEDGYFIFEITNFIHFFNTIRVDQFAHLRRRWFTVRYVNSLLNLHGLFINKINFDENYRGGTYTIIASRKMINNNNLENILSKEKILSMSYFTQFQNDLANLKDDIKKYLNTLDELVGYGAGIKSSTLLNWLELNTDKITYTVDTDEKKIGNFIPLCNIPIYNIDTLINKKVNIIHLSLDHEKEVIEFLQQNLLKGSKIIKILPEIEEIVVE